MRMRYFLAALLAFLFGTMGMQPAHADIYTWVDANGSINVSNMTPPDGAHVTNVTHESVPRVAPAADAMRQADVQALTQRVQQLESELAMAQYQQPPPQAYTVMQPPPVVQYFVDASSPQVQYNSSGPTGCDSGWGDCGGSWWNAGVFPVGVAFLQAPRFKRLPPMRERQFAGKPPMQGGGGFRRG
jgi:Domain of unknown function (DUF4124)